MRFYHRDGQASQILAVNRQEHQNNVSTSADEDKSLRLCARELNFYCRNHYATQMYNIGRNLYPMIVAMEFEQDFPGIGSVYHLYRNDHSEEVISPAANTQYETYKSFSHVLIGMHSVLSPYFKNPKATAWTITLKHILDRVIIAHEAVCAHPDATLRSHLQPLLELYVDFMKERLATRHSTLDLWLAMTEKAFPLVAASVNYAVSMQCQEVLPALLKWKEELGPEEWAKLYVVIPTVWPVSLNSPREILFRQIMDPRFVDTHIIKSDYPRNVEEARSLVGRVVGDRAMGTFSFGTQSVPAIMKVLAFGSETDIVADDFEAVLVKELRKNGVEWNENVRLPDTKGKGACPMHIIRDAAKNADANASK